MTETAPSCTFAVGTDVRAGEIGLPIPAVEVKIVPMGDKSEIRFRGPNVARLHVLAEPPSIDKGESTDKGSINHHAVLAHRAALVEALCNGADPQAFHPRKEMKR